MNDIRFHIYVVISVRGSSCGNIYLSINHSSIIRVKIAFFYRSQNFQMWTIVSWISPKHQYRHSSVWLSTWTWSKCHQSEEYNHLSSDRQWKNLRCWFVFSFLFSKMKFSFINQVLFDYEEYICKSKEILRVFYRATSSDAQTTNRKIKTIWKSSCDCRRRFC